MDASGKHIAVIVDNYFEQSEFEEPISAMKDAGAEVSVIATKDMELFGMNHAKIGDKFSADLLIHQADSVDYDALIIPGGAINADNLRMNESAQEWVNDFINSDRPLAIICHSPWLLVSSDCVEGRRLTSYFTIQDDIRNAGGEWVDLEVVIDGNLITSRGPDDIPRFNQAILNKLSRKTEVASASVVDMPYSVSEQNMDDELKLKSLGHRESTDQMNENDRNDVVSDDILDDD